MKKKALSMLLALVMCLSMLPATAFAETKSGTGWNFDTATGTLTISGELKSADPWISAGVDADKIISVVTKKGAKAPKDSSYMFYYHDNLKSADLSKLDTSDATNMYCMFRNCSSLTSLNLSGWDTSNVTSMNCMFDGCSSLMALDVSSFDTRNVTDMLQMFFGCSSLTSLNLSGFNTSKVTEMLQMFSYCSKLTTLDVSSFDTRNVNDMDSMFYGCSSLASLNLISWDTSNVTIMKSMFDGCSSLTSLNLSGFDTSKVTEMWTMFESCSSLTTLDLSGFDTGNVNDMGWMFADCSGLKEISLPANFYKGSDLTELFDLHATWYGSDGKAYTSDEQLANNKAVTLSADKSTPTGLETANNLTTGRVKLSWNAVENASGYNIYRATSANGSYTKLASNVTATNYTDGKSGNAGNTYYYKVSAVVGGRESEPSEAVSQISKCQRPVGLSATANDGGTVTLTWDAPLVRTSVSYYRVYKWNGVESKFEWIGGTLKAEGGENTTFTIPTEYVTSGGSTQYSIRGYNTKDTLGSMSIYAAAASCTVLAGPTGLTPANNLTTGRVKLSWNAVAGATGYNIYRATSANGAYTKINDSAVTTTNYTDGKSGNAGNTYYYKVSAVVGGTETALSTAVSQMSKCQRPAGLSATANSDGTVTLTWDAPAVSGSVSYYRVYKWNGTGFEWIGGSLKTEGSNTTFTIPAEYVTPGVSTQYSIRGYNTKDILGSMSIYAATASCTAPKSAASSSTSSSTVTG